MVGGISLVMNSQRTMEQAKGLNNTEDNTATDFHNQLLNAISDKKKDIVQKIKNGETEDSFQIGGSSLTIKEWEKLMKKVDKAIDSMKEIVEEETEKKKEEAISTETINKKEQIQSENWQI